MIRLYDFEENCNVIISHFPHSPLMQSVESCCAADFLCHVLKTLFFIEIALKLSYFAKKSKIFFHATRFLMPRFKNIIFY